MAALIAWWSFLQAATQDGNPRGYSGGPVFWFWIAVMVVILGLFMFRFARHRRPPPMGPR